MDNGYHIGSIPSYEGVIVLLNTLVFTDSTILMFGRDAILSTKDWNTASVRGSVEPGITTLARMDTPDGLCTNLISH